MKFKQFKEVISNLSSELDDKDVKIEYPTEKGITNYIDATYVEWDEADFIISFLNPFNNPTI